MDGSGIVELWRYVIQENIQDWYDEFLDWDPHDYDMINQTTVPYNEIWIPDTYLYNR